MIYALIRVINELALPPLGPFALLIVAFLLRTRLRRASGALALLACVWMFAFSLPGTYRWLRSPWPNVPERIAPPYPPAEAIVVLGGGRYLDAPEYGGDTAGPSTLERLRYGAKLHRETGLPLLVSGGKQGDFGTRTEAEIMQEILATEYQLSAKWVENQSQDTRSNAEFSAQLLRKANITRIFLVTHEMHMARAQQEFEQQGLQVVPMTTGFSRPDATSIHLWIPSFYGLSLCRYWLQEKLAPLNPF